MLVIKNLQGVPLAEIIDCLLQAFDGYFVKMPESLAYWDSRFKGSRVDWHLSYGVFIENKMIGFVINGIDEGVAFNTGTGILPEYRGKRLVDKIYNYALPFFRKNQIHKCALEVITQNERAIKVYERIGFLKVNEMKCYSGKIKQDNDSDFQIEKSPSLALDSVFDHNYSWDNTSRALSIHKDLYQKYIIKSKNNRIGEFIINPNNGYLAQCELYVPESIEAWNQLFKAAHGFHKSIKLNNVPVSRTLLIEYLTNSSLANTIDQYEMEMDIPILPDQDV